MNKQRRKALGAIIDRVTKINEAVNELVTGSDFAYMLEELDGLKSEEEEYLENMPDALQTGEKGATAQEAIDAMESAIDKLTALQDALNEFEGDDVIRSLDDARGMEG